MSTDYFTLEAFRKQLHDDTLTEEQIREQYRAELQRRQEETQKIVNNYSKLDMDKFIEHIGGMDKINEMKAIIDSDNKPTVQQPRKLDERDIEEWKQGFMDGFEEAYKRLNNSKS